MRRRLRLPRLWAGFRPRDVGGLRAEGPEIELLCRRLGTTPSVMLERTVRPFEGLALCPLDWANGQLERAVAVFARMPGCVPRQVAPFTKLPDGLVGFQGACAFDFYSSRFRRSAQSMSIQ